MAGAIVLVPVGQEAGDGVLQRLGQRQSAGDEPGVARIARGWRVVVRRRAAAAGCRSCGARSSPAPRRAWPRSPPCSAPAARRSGARSAASCVVDRNPQQIELVERDPQRADGALEHRGVGEIERRSRLRFSSRPASRASSRPLSERSTSVQPVKRFSLFQVLSPWRSRTSLYMACLLRVRQRADRGSAGVDWPRDPSSSSMRSSWLYFADAIAAAGRSGLDLAGGGADREIGDGRVFGLARAVRDDRGVAGVARPSRIASSVSVTVPIWFSFTSSALPTPSAMPRFRISGLVTNTSSPTSCTVSPSACGQHLPAVPVAFGEAVFDRDDRILPHQSS